MQRCKPLPHRRNQAGVTMIELLVSILIFAFGMLGLVGLQNKTLGYSQISLFRSQAAALSDDILDRMRADRANAKAGSWATEMTDVWSDYTGTTVAEKDLRSWKRAVADLLPSGQAQIVNDTNRITITIQWTERGTTSSFKTVTIL